MASTTEEIAIKLGIDVTAFKAALADANTSVKKLKKEGEGDFFDGFKQAKKSLGDLKNAVAAAGIGAAVANFFQVAIDAANKSTDATDKNAAAVREFARGLEEAKGIGASVAVATVGFFNRIGAAIGDGIVILKAFGHGQLEGAKNAVAGLRLVEETGKAAEEVERRLAEVRKKHGAEFLSITKELADLEKKRAEQQLQGLTVYETEANLAKKLGDLRAKLATFDGEAIDRRRLALQVAQAQFELEKVNLAVRKERAQEEKKAAEDEKKAFEEYAKAAADRRKEQSLSAEKEAQLFALRKKAADAAATQGQTDLSITALQTRQMVLQLEIQKERAKAAGSLSPAERANLEELRKQSAEIAAQITAKKALIAASNARDPLETKLLGQLQAQASALNAQIAGLEKRAGVTNNFTEAEAKFLAQLQQQKTAIFDQIALLEKRAATPNTITAEETALLAPLKEQARTYTLLIGLMKERKGTGTAQTAEEVSYLDALKASATTIVTQVEQLRTRNAASLGLRESEAKTLAQWEEQSNALVDQIEALEKRQNSSTGINEAEAERLATLIREEEVIGRQIESMRERHTATGNLAGVENAVLLQWEAQQKALATQVETMRSRKSVTEEQRAADVARLETLVQAKAATEAQIEAQQKGKVVIEANAQAVVKMTAAEKERQAILELLATKQKQNVELKELEARIQKEGINPALAAEYKQLQLNVEATNQQLLAKQKVSLGVKEDLELFKLQAKNQLSLTEQERVRKDELVLQTKEKRLQIEIEGLHGKLLDGTITPAEEKKLASLIKQTVEVGKQITANQDLAKVITNKVQPAEDELSVEFDGQVLKVGQLIDAKTRAALTASGIQLDGEKKITAEIIKQVEESNKLIKGKITNTGDIGGLDNSALSSLLIKLNRDLSTQLASSLTQRQDTVIEASLKAQIAAIQKELDTRKDFQRALDFLGSGKTQVQFGQSEFNRLQGLVNPDLQKQTANGITKITDILSRTFPEAARNVR